MLDPNRREFIALLGAGVLLLAVRFFFSSRRRHTRCLSDWSSDVCSSDLALDWLLGAYGHTLGNLDTAVASIGPDSGISSTLGLTDARGLPLAQALNGQGLDRKSVV